jgi:hypothetical protein
LLKPQQTHLEAQNQPIKGEIIRGAKRIKMRKKYERNLVKV